MQNQFMDAHCICISEFKKRECVVDELAACSMKSAYISAICKTFRWGSG